MLLIRKANAEDAPLLAEMIREFADFQHELDEVDLTSQDLIRDGFGPDPRFQALIAEWDGETAAYAVYFFTYSTWAGRPSLYLEDLFVRPGFRDKGIGKAVLKYMAVIAREQNCFGMNWQVRNWNTPAIEFYRSIGATLQDDKVPVVFMGEQFEKFGSDDGQP